MVNGNIGNERRHSSVHVKFESQSTKGTTDFMHEQRLSRPWQRLSSATQACPAERSVQCCGLNAPPPSDD
jgi:hypothetical protein